MPVCNPLALVIAFTEGGEEGFPFFLGLGFEGVGVEGHGGKAENLKS